MRALKESIWSLLRRGASLPGAAASGAVSGLAASSTSSSQGSVGFKEVVMRGLADAAQARTAESMPSVHLAFMCVLHLANENGLCVSGHPNLDRLDILVPCQ